MIFTNKNKLLGANEFVLDSRFPSKRTLPHTNSLSSNEFKINIKTITTQSCKGLLKQKKNIIRIVSFPGLLLCNLMSGLTKKLHIYFL